MDWLQPMYAWRPVQFTVFEQMQRGTQLPAVSEHRSCSGLFITQRSTVAHKSGTLPTALTPYVIKQGAQHIEVHIQRAYNTAMTVTQHQ